MATGFLYDTRFLEHKTSPGHPECPERIEKTFAHLKQLSWFDELKNIEAKKADVESLLGVHSKSYIDEAKKACSNEESFLHTPDVSISKNSFDTALLATGGTLQLVDQVLEKNVRNAFGLLRPPGHHAESSQAMGFCLFNNIAIAAAYLKNKHKLNKVLILDWDVHHGNGTQHIFEEDPSVLYISLHQYPFYPGTGSYRETGTGKGEGSILNCPIKAFSGDFEYQFAFEDFVLPKIHSFKPEFILISSGFDAYKEDPLSQMNVSIECFGWMTEKILEVANLYAKDQIVSILEGGYNLDALPLCIEEHISTLMQSK